MREYVETLAQAAWVCADCRATLGEVGLDSGSDYLHLATVQLTGAVRLPVTRLCGRCGAANHLTGQDVHRWRRHGGARPLIAARRPALVLAHTG